MVRPQSLHEHKYLLADPSGQGLVLPD